MLFRHTQRLRVLFSFTSYLLIELFVLPEEVDAELREPDEVLQLLAGRDDHLADHLLCGLISRVWVGLSKRVFVWDLP